MFAILEWEYVILRSRRGKLNSVSREPVVRQLTRCTFARLTTSLYTNPSIEPTSPVLVIVLGVLGWLLFATLIIGTTIALMKWKRVSYNVSLRNRLAHREAESNPDFDTSNL